MNATEGYHYCFLLSFIRYNTDGKGELYYIIMTKTRTYVYLLNNATSESNLPNVKFYRNGDYMKIVAERAGSFVIKFSRKAGTSNIVYPTYSFAKGTDTTGYTQISVVM